MTEREKTLDLDERDRDDEEIELFFADGKKMKAKRWMVKKAMEEVARNNFVKTIQAEIGLVRYFEKIKENG